MDPITHIKIINGLASGLNKLDEEANKIIDTQLDNGYVCVNTDMCVLRVENMTHVLILLSFALKTDEQQP